MNILKKALLGATMAAALVASASAAVVSVGGVTWDTAAVGSNGQVLDFSGNSDSLYQEITNNANFDVSGYGQITNINGSSSFCATCTLTYEFGGFDLVSSGSLGGVTVRIYNDGWVKVYVNDGGVSSLWLDMVGYALDGASLTGTINSTSAGVTGVAGTGQLAVVGGLAATYFDTNAMPGGADFTFGTIFTSYDATDPAKLVSFGTGTFSSKTAEVPEPASIALMGLGLLGLAARRRKAKSV